jgi:FAD/FMN-containing dehydrogenase
MLIVLFAMTPVFGQTKIEREYKVPAAEVPEEARQVIDSLPFDRTEKWYGEENQDGKAYELKTKYRGRWYSIKFSTSGALIDVEVEIPRKVLPDSVDQGMQKNLSQRFRSYRLRKIQIQYTGPREQLKDVVRGEEPGADVAVRYEVVIKGKTKKDVRLYEVLFSEEGTWLEMLPIELRNTDNLQY